MLDVGGLIAAFKGSRADRLINLSRRLKSGARNSAPLALPTMAKLVLELAKGLVFFITDASDRQFQLGTDLRTDQPRIHSPMIRS